MPQAMSVMDQILSIDEQLFLWVNVKWSSSWGDFLFPLLRNRDTWVPFYLLLAGWLFYRFRWKGLLFVLVIAASTGLTDLVSSSVIKPLVGRERPCKAEDWPAEINVLVHCGNNGSFTSSHAANHTAIAVSISILLLASKRWLSVLLLIWAASIGVAQVYVGVHYPSDIVGGMLTGAMVAMSVCLGARKMGLKRERV